MTRFCRLLCGSVFSCAILAGVVEAQTETSHDESAWLRDVRQLTSTKQGLARSGEGYFSADGKRICFQSYPVGADSYQIYVVNLDGSDLQMVSTGRGATTCSFFHPSGEKLIFAANHHDMREPEGGEEVEQFRKRSGESGGHPAAHGGGGEKPAAAGSQSGQKEGGAHLHPPKGEQAAGHAAGHGDDHGHGHGHGDGGGGPSGRHSYAWKYFPGMDIWEYTFATKALKRLTTSDGYDAECAYSPDGKSIVFSSFRDGDQEIYICDADGSNPRRITKAEGKDGGPFFSADGKRVCYRSDRRGDGMLQVYTNNTEGTDEQLVVDDGVFNWCPYFHPSGKWLVFTRADFRKGGRFDVYVVRTDGSDLRRVTSEGEWNGLPVFSPDGRYLAWSSMREGADTPQIFIAEFIGLTPEGELRAQAKAQKGSEQHGH